MQKLHLVGFTADHDGLIFSTRKGAKSGSYVVPLDGRLLKQIADAERRREGGSSTRADGHRSGSPRLVRPESALSPREMQDRIRAGWSLEEVAGEAGVDLDWVSRFAAPVLAEVRRVIDQALDLVYDKPRVGLSALPLRGSVRRNVLDRGVRFADEDEFAECWSAYQLDEESWVVRFAYTSRNRLQEAEWRLDLETEELTSRNRLASQLGHVVKARAKRPVAMTPAPPKRAARKVPPPPPAPEPPPKPRAKKAAPTRRPTARTTSTRKKAAARPAKKRAKGERPPEPPAWRPTPIPVVPPTPNLRPSPRPAAAVRGPLPPPPPMPVPPAVREAVAVPLGDVEAPPRPGPAAIDPDTGVARIDSRRMWHAPPPGTHRSASPDGVTRADDERPARPRRAAPLRAR